DSTVGALGESSRRGFELAQFTRYQNPVPDGVRPDSQTEMALAPMPTQFDLCSAGDSAACSDGVFFRGDADSGSLRLRASPRARFRYYDQPTLQAQVYSQVDLTVGLFYFQGDATDAGFLGF